MDGTIDDPTILLQVKLDQGLLRGDPFSISSSVSYTSEALELSDTNVVFRSSIFSNASGKISLDTGAFSVVSSYRGILQSDVIRSSIESEGSFALENGLSDIASSDFSLSLRVSQLTLGDDDIDPLFFSAERSAGVITFAGGPSQSINGRIEAEGMFTLNLSAPLPLMFTGTGRIKDSIIEATLTNVVADMSRIDRFLAIPYFKFERGLAEGNMKILGNVNDPDMFGQLRGEELFARTPVVPEIIGPVDASLAFNGKTLRMSNVVLPAGPGLILGNAEFTFDHWIPELYDIKLSTIGKPGAHVKYVFEGTEVDGYAQGEIAITGDSLGTDIKGSFLIERCSITIIEENEYEIPGGDDLSNVTTIDISFTTGRQVEFLWPTRSLPILRGFADTGEHIRITSDSLDGSFSIDGDIGFKGGEVFYFKRSFYIREGKIFFQENETKFDPVLSARAELREITDEGEDVTIYLVLEERPISQFSPRFESKPLLSNAEIFRMLGASIFTVNGEEGINLVQRYC